MLKYQAEETRLWTRARVCVRACAQLSSERVQQKDTYRSDTTQSFYGNVTGYWHVPWRLSTITTESTAT
jgi:hypothetical protein